MAQLLCQICERPIEMKEGFSSAELQEYPGMSSQDVQSERSRDLELVEFFELLSASSVEGYDLHPLCADCTTITVQNQAKELANKSHEHGVYHRILEQLRTLPTPSREEQNQSLDDDLRQLQEEEDRLLSELQQSTRALQDSRRALDQNRFDQSRIALLTEQ